MKTIKASLQFFKDIATGKANVIDYFTFISITILEVFLVTYIIYLT